jgi:hypothetical protein
VQVRPGSSFLLFLFKSCKNHISQTVNRNKMFYI